MTKQTLSPDPLGPEALEWTGAMTIPVDLEFQIISRNVRSTSGLGLAFQDREKIHGS
jgi:hypothetical protein